ncbi:hypothetical protein FO519_008928 [Halicephalobus sp. NKZ332]|nr:hypothetical protein FO519_008928 [Halicephalobus sp. NKZ332]
MDAVNNLANSAVEGAEAAKDQVVVVGQATVDGAGSAATKTEETIGTGIDALKSAINTLGVAVADLADKISNAEKNGESQESEKKEEISPSEVEQKENEEVPADQKAEDKVEEVIPPPVQASDSQNPQLSHDQEVIDNVNEVVEKVVVEEEKKEDKEEDKKEEQEDKKEEDAQSEGIKNVILNTAQNLVGLISGQNAEEKKEQTPPVVDNAGEDVPAPKNVGALTAESTNPFENAEENEVVQREEIYHEQTEVQQEAPQKY